MPGSRAPADPKLRLIFFGTGQAKAGKNGIGDKLFSNSATIALDVDTEAKLKWYNQSAPRREGLDLDEVYEKVLVDEWFAEDRPDRRQEGHSVEARPHKWQVPRLCADQGDPRMSSPTLTDQGWPRHLSLSDILNPDPGGSRSLLPGSSRRGPRWPASSYVPEDYDLRYLSADDQICVTSQGDMIGSFEAPASDGNIGRLSAYRVKDLRSRSGPWQQRAPFLTSSMTTAGGIGFVGDWDRTFRAFDIQDRQDA